MGKTKINCVLSLFFLFGLGCLAISCVHELPVPESASTGTASGGTNTGGNTGTPPPIATCSTDTVYFNNSILPMINSVCGKSGCHGSTGRGAFSMTTYSSIVNRLGTSNRLNGALQDMAGQKKDNPNLNYVPPTSAQLTQLQTWIAQGAKNNTCNGCDTTKFTFAAIVSPIISTYCAGCHSGASPSFGIDLSSYSAIQTEVTKNPGRLLGSIEWTSPYTRANQMPSGGSQLPACYIAQIKKWIAAGAPNN